MLNGSANMGSPPIEQLQGMVERLTFHSEESGYTVAYLKLPNPVTGYLSIK